MRVELQDLRSVTAHQARPTDSEGPADKPWEPGQVALLSHPCRPAKGRYRRGCRRRRLRRTEEFADSGLTWWDVVMGPEAFYFPFARFGLLFPECFRLNFRSNSGQNSFKMLPAISTPS